MRRPGFLICRITLASSLALLLPCGARAGEMTPDQKAFFEARIRPVLVKQCYECHSAQSRKIGGKLLLDSAPEMLSGGESGPALIPGNADESLIVQALRYEGVEMPPKAPLSDAVVADFVTWVKMGAPDPRTSAASKNAQSATAATKEDLWAYQPVKHPATPAVKQRDWPRDPIDHFVLARMEAVHLAPAADAPAAELVRRIYFDIIGLPPGAEEVRAFTMESYERLVDRLLASPQFGERWGRHWLDVARYAESNGNDGLSRNPSFPHAWRYRDYVIQALNEDTPYDRFITEQIAGDLLPAATPVQRDRHLIATGFLAIGSKPAKAMNDNFEMDVVADQVGAVGQGIMGLTVGCARCHDHKTDPIPTRDYYALAGIFKSTQTLWGAAAYEGLTAPQTPLHELQGAARVTPGTGDVLKSPKESKKAPAKPSYPYAVDAALAMGVRDAKTCEDCKLNIDGDSRKLGASIPRGFLAACGAVPPEVNVAASQSGRLQLAQWLTSPSHPLTARVLVNRVWQHLMGEGIVRTPDDFGVYGMRPTHPELLDYLATRFMAEGWSLKRLIREIVLSRTYRLGSDCDAGTLKADPENILLARHSRRRLAAEELRDAMLCASGELDAQPGRGSLIRFSDVLINQMGDLHRPSRHRSVYLLMLRNSLPPELAPFNMPDGTAVTGRRDVTTLPTQALYLLNNQFLVSQSQQLARRVLHAADANDSRVRVAYERALSRLPSDAEVRRALDFIREADLMLASSGTTAASSDLEARAWSAFCQALLASNEFRYVD